eukprot:TRINITY_DN109842_c0_g1_i1.p1 TRINITY_DN109842_c0_g1~~TRINITY_DN109842_c0_g1_i1.p1  ORF type:complete len:319 (+),score=43.83 TRINITY_DN109842_c0_g1_i1:57-1013(+)
MAEQADRQLVPGLLFVGKVKSTADSQTLRDVFERHGQLEWVETGFAGFAFVKYENSRDADYAVNKMHNQFIPGFGSHPVQPASQKGYDDAVVKREEFLKMAGGLRSPNRSPNRASGRKFELGARKPPIGNREGSRSRSRSASASWRRRSRPASRSRSRSRVRSRPPPIGSATRPSRAANHEVVPYISKAQSKPANSSLSRSDRAKVLCFFEGSSIRDLLLEAVPLAQFANAPQESSSTTFPQSFEDCSGREASELLRVAERFAQSGNRGRREDRGDSDLEEKSIEIRQMIAIDAKGQRVLRKAVFVNGIRGGASQQVI